MEKSESDMAHLSAVQMIKRDQYRGSEFRKILYSIDFFYLRTKQATTAEDIASGRPKVQKIDRKQYVVNGL